MIEGIDFKLCERFDKLDKAIENLSAKIDSKNAILESKIEKMKQSQDDTCAIQAKWVLKFLVPTMTIIPLLLACLIFWRIWQGNQIEIYEVWFLCIIFIAFCAFAVMLTRTLMLRND